MASDGAARFNDTLELLKAARAGDRPAIEDLVERYGAHLLDRIRLLMGPLARREADSVDFLQDVFLEISRGNPDAGFQDEVGFLRWATAVARNRIRARVRAGKRDQALSQWSLDQDSAGSSESLSGPERGAIDIERRDRLESAMAQLCEEHREVLRLRDRESQSFREIAAHMGRSVNAVQLLHARALVQFARAMDHDDPL